MKCFRYNLNNKNQGPAGILPTGSITGIYVNNAYYGAALIEDLKLLSDWNAIEISYLEFNTICTSSPTEENPNPVPALVQLEPYVRQKYSELLENIIAPYQIQERETWFIQLEEALKYQANPSINTNEIPFLVALSNQRSQSIEDIANNIIQKNIIYRTNVGTILGKQQSIIQQLWTI